MMIRLLETINEMIIVTIKAIAVIAVLWAFMDICALLVDVFIIRR